MNMQAKVKQYRCCCIYQFMDEYKDSPDWMIGDFLDIPVSEVRLLREKYKTNYLSCSDLDSCKMSTVGSVGYSVL